MNNDDLITNAHNSKLILSHGLHNDSDDSMETGR